MELSQRKCIPCEDKDAKVLSKEEIYGDLLSKIAEN